VSRWRSLRSHGENQHLKISQFRTTLEYSNFEYPYHPEECLVGEACVLLYGGKHAEDETNQHNHEPKHIIKYVNIKFHLKKIAVPRDLGLSWCSLKIFVGSRFFGLHPFNILYVIKEIDTKKVFQINMLADASGYEPLLYLKMF
jgi:hypothetical protein